jgi:pyruvate/2-oxoglutarate dehydrogenase complex dihydrolipoamide acyltransferase (E2) component
MAPQKKKPTAAKAGKPKEKPAPRAKAASPAPKAAQKANPAEVAAIRRSFEENLVRRQGRFAPVASMNDYYLALAYTVRDRLLDRWTKTSKTYFEKASRTRVQKNGNYPAFNVSGNSLAKASDEP